MYENSRSHLTACPIFFMSTMPSVSVQRNEPTTIDTHRSPTWTNLVFLLVAVMLLWRLARQLHMTVRTHEVHLRTTEDFASCWNHVTRSPKYEKQRVHVFIFFTDGFETDLWKKTYWIQHCSDSACVLFKSNNVSFKVKRCQKHQCLSTGVTWRTSSNQF